MIRHILVFLLLVYIGLCIRYFFRFSNDMTLYIESENRPIRLYDTVLTLYENTNNIEIISKKIARDGVVTRSFLNRVFYMDCENKIAQIYIFGPNQTKKLAPYFFSTTSDVHIEKDYKRYEFLELSLSCGNFFFVPRGYWIYFDKGIHTIYEVTIKHDS